MPFQTFTARLVRSVALSELTKHLEFEMNGVGRFGFVPGQWLSFKTNEPDGEEIIRAYSLASPPETDSKFALCLNRVQDGFMSNFLCDMKEGDEIQCQGPFGDFILRPPMRDAIFIATGTGIAPFRSMLRWLFGSIPGLEVDGRGRPSSIEGQGRHRGHQLWLVFGNRTERDIYYHDEFLRLAEEHPNFHYLPTLSRGDPDWQGLRGYVQGALQLSLPAHTQPWRCGMAGPSRLRAGTCPRHRPGSNRHARLHLRSGQDGQSQP